MNQKTCSIFTAVALGLLMVGNTARAELPDFVSVTMDPSCGPAVVDVPGSGPNRGSLVVQLQDFSVEASRETDGQRSCELAATIRVPPGMTFQPVRAFADGEVSTSENGTAHVALSYRWGTTEPPCVRSAESSFAPRTEQAYVVSTAAFDPGLWVSCDENAPDREVTIHGRLDISASRDPNDRRASDISVYNSEGQAVRWIWTWASCGFNEKVFRSRYTNPHGIWIRGTTKLVGDHGEYQTDSGRHGTLEDVRYEEAGRVAKGVWLYETGDRGWFIFRIDPDGAGFTGTWGYGDEAGVDEGGRWQGSQLAIF